MSHILINVKLIVFAIFAFSTFSLSSQTFDNLYINSLLEKYSIVESQSDFKTQNFIILPQSVATKEEILAHEQSIRNLLNSSAVEVIGRDQRKLYLKLILEEIEK